jgi:hypothetical protein
LELEIKSRHLLSKSQKQVKTDYSHNLKKGYDALDSAQQILSQTELNILDNASKVYKDKGFEYFSPVDAMTGYKRFPPLNDLETVAEKLIKGSPLHNEEFKKTYLLNEWASLV